MATRCLRPQQSKPYFRKLEQFLEKERQTFSIHPPEKDIFSALQLTPYKNVSVLLLCQDP